MKKIKHIIMYFLLTCAALSFIYPFYWMIIASLTPEQLIAGFTLIPRELTLENYRSMIEKIPIFRAFLNSVFVASASTTGILVFGSMVGYALSKIRYRGRELIFYIIIFTMTLPFQITLIPNYILMIRFQWVDTFAALIIPALNSAFAIIMFRQAFKSIPNDLIDAARVDGCSHLRIIFGVLWPNIIPTIITVSIISFMNSWNDVLWPLIVIRDADLMTMPQLVTLFSIGGRSDAQLGVKLASAVLLALPIIIAYIIFQKHFIRSMATSGLKG
ncbi:MAG TPA: carbohydrate ABC transporter permease [Bacteroidales bacterium]|nr:carbohydrate ABC transporter permease [Bacteroidales bacterium]HPE57643.1 carbohydrate ABC transporter permease [Bacteroidales bacterium]